MQETKAKSFRDIGIKSREFFKLNFPKVFSVFVLLKRREHLGLQARISTPKGPSTPGPQTLAYSLKPSYSPASNLFTLNGVIGSSESSAQFVLHTPIEASFRLANVTSTGLSTRAVVGVPWKNFGIRFTGEMKEKSAFAAGIIGIVQTKDARIKTKLDYSDHYKACLASGQFSVQVPDDFFASVKGEYTASVLPPAEHPDAKTCSNSYGRWFFENPPLYGALKAKVGILKSEFEIHAFYEKVWTAAQLAGTSDTKPKEEYGCALWQQVSENVTVASHFQVTPPNSRSCTVGGDVKLTDTVTLKGALAVTTPMPTAENPEPEFRLLNTFKHQLKPGVGVSLTADWNLRQLMGNSKGRPHGFGASTTIEL